MRVAHRDADLGDRPYNTERRFILDAWQRSFWEAPESGFIARHTYAKVMIPELAAVVRRPGVRTVVAYDADDPGGLADLFGFVCAEPESVPPFVYYVYVKEAYRRHGIATSLMRAVGLGPESRFDYGCRTAVVRELERRIPLARYEHLGARFDRDHRRSRR